MTVPPLGRGHRARYKAYDLELVGVVTLRQRGAEAAHGGDDAKYELAIETRQRETRRRNECGVNAVKGTASRCWQALPGRWQVGPSKVVERRGELGEVLGESATVSSETEDGAGLARVARLRILVGRTRRRRFDTDTSGAGKVADVCDLSTPGEALRQLAHEAAGLDRQEHIVQVIPVRLLVDDGVADVQCRGTTSPTTKSSIHPKVDFGA